MRSTRSGWLRPRRKTRPCGHRNPAGDGDTLVEAWVGSPQQGGTGAAEIGCATPVMESGLGEKDCSSSFSSLFSSCR